MHIGILPRYVAPNLSDPEWLRAWAATMDDAGVESVWAVEHPAVPAVIDSPYPYTRDGRISFSPEVPFPDPIETLTFVAAVTRRVRLGTAIIVLPLHHPIALAKRCATLDALSQGRFMLGVGVGWMREEFDAFGVPFEGRGARAEEYVQVLRHLWSRAEKPFHGSFMSFGTLRIDPAPVHAGGPPVIIGGSSRVAARRAGRLGDGWYPAAIAPDVLEARLDDLRDAARSAGREPDEIEVTVRPAGLSPHGSFDRELVTAYRRLGVARIVIGSDEAPGPDPSDSVALVERFRDEMLA